MDTLIQHLDTILYILQNGIIGLLCANVFIQLIMSHKENKDYNKVMMALNSITLLVFCLCLFVNKKAFPLYTFTEWKKPLLFLAAALFITMLWTCIIGIRRNIYAAVVTPVECMLFLLLQYVVSLYSPESTRPYMTEFHQVFERIGIALLLFSLFLICFKFKFYQVKKGFQIYLSITILGLCFLSETIRALILRYLPIVIGAYILLNIVEFIWNHKKKRRRKPVRPSKRRKPAKTSRTSRTSKPSKVSRTTKTSRNTKTSGNNGLPSFPKDKTSSSDDRSSLSNYEEPSSVDSYNESEDEIDDKY